VQRDLESVAEALAVRLEALRVQPPLMIPSRSRSGSVARTSSTSTVSLGSVPPSMWWIIADCARSIGLRRVASSFTPGSVSAIRSDTIAGRCRQNK